MLLNKDKISELRNLRNYVIILLETFETNHFIFPGFSVFIANNTESLTNS